ncbi:hypothetical protein [Cupriavidus basilensis]|uniref:hypothetical protein n=1 Tax=Cupriavidus basilensis TaxID=68895 RepID=UPI00157B0AA2|nr:hypothetical protein [Cupriavidus basilensis]NUA30256.1 hypothetical protein [Cupriavidus basilensis]
MTTPNTHRRAPHDGAPYPNVRSAAGSTRMLALTCRINPAQAFQADGPLQRTGSECLPGA